MVGNRHLFTWFLHGAIFALGLVLGTLGILGYLAFGNNIQQMLNKNLPSGQFLAMFVNVGICVGVILTFPLQIFPVIEIIENYLFSEGTLMLYGVSMVEYVSHLGNTPLNHIYKF